MFVFFRSFWLLQHNFSVTNKQRISLTETIVRTFHRFKCTKFYLILNNFQKNVSCDIYDDDYTEIRSLESEFLFPGTEIFSTMPQKCQY